MTEVIAASSLVSWPRINLPGERSFSDEALQDSLRFDRDGPVAFNWETTTPPAV